MSRVENNAKLIEHLRTLISDTDNLSAEDLAMVQFSILVDISKSLAVIADKAEGTND